jgi:hypothetical protein
MGRKSTYTQETADAICKRLTEGESLRAVCADTGLAIATVLLWAKTHQEFAEQYARAMEIRAHRMVDEMREIAAGVCDQASAARARLEIDVIKWQASKMLPKVYGDRIETTVQGPNGGPVEFSEIRRVIVDGSSQP